MRISELVTFLERIQEQDGDLEILAVTDRYMAKSVTGMWLRARPSTGERVVMLSTGDGLPEGW